MKRIPTAHPDLVLIEPSVYADERGHFLETWNARSFSELGVDANFVQENHSSSRRGVLRGLHYQLQHAQGKLIRVVAGEVFDAVVDLRRSSTHFGQASTFVLSAQNHHLLWVPPGFAHGLLVTSDHAEVSYKVTAPYSPTDEHTLLWNDPALAIDWPAVSPLIVNARDRAGLLLSQAQTYE